MAREKKKKDKEKECGFPTKFSWNWLLLRNIFQNHVDSDKLWSASHF